MLSASARRHPEKRPAMRRADRLFQIIQVLRRTRKPLTADARAAEDLMSKIADPVPERLRPFVLEPASRARPAWQKEADRIDMVRTRSQIHEGKKIALRYRDEHGRDSERTIWPIAIGYLEAVRLLAAWCELRKDFRSFRT